MNIDVYNKLIKIAKKGGIISYQDISSQCNLKLNMQNISDRNKLAGLLGDISIFEVNNNRHMLSVVVINQTENKSGSGFFELAEQLGLYNGSNNDFQREKFFSDELNKCYDYWKKQK